MAHIIPKHIPEQLESDPFRQAELRLYKASETLSNKWRVLYGVAWYFTEDGKCYEGEADFVFISEEHGITVVEVKGGGISREDDCWYSIDRNGGKHRIKNPVEQAAKAKHRILQYLKQNHEFAHTYIPMTHMVCFPNIMRADLPSIIDMPKDIVICFEDLQNLSERLEDISEKGTKISNSLVTEICKYLKPEFTCPIKYSVTAKRNLQIIERLTDEQARIWDMLDDNRYVGLSGPAGSGKTILAIKKIKREIDNGGNVLILIPSKTLNDYYRAMFPSDRIIIKNYNDKPLPLNTIGMQLKELLQPNLVVIDEAQDLTEDTWLQFYENYSIETVEKLLIVYDSNQKLRNRDTFYLPKNLVLLQLDSVIRNTQQIGKFSLGFYANPKNVKCLGPDGTNVKFVESSDPNKDLEIAVQSIKKFVFEDGFEYSDITVLTGRGGTNRSAFISDEDEFAKNELGITFRTHLNSQNETLHKHPIVRIENLHRFRGLESNIVILVGLDIAKPEELIPWCYIGASRAKIALVIIATKALLKKINSEVRSVRTPTSRFHIDTGPVSLFDRVNQVYSDIKSLSQQVETYTNKEEGNEIPDEVFDALNNFDRSRLKLIMAEVRNDKGKFVSSIWSLNTKNGVYWIEIGFNNNINSIIKPIYGNTSESVVKYGYIYDFVSDVNKKLIEEEQHK